MIGRKWWPPWLWLAPAILLSGVFLVYPMLDTMRRSLMGPAGDRWSGFDNYAYILRNPSPFLVDTHQALWNNLLWIVLFTAATVTLGMVFAVMASRVRYEAAAKSALFIPMAISFVAASVIWKFMYDFNPKIGTINAVMTRLGLHQKAWLTSSESLLHALAGLGPTRLTGPLQVNNLALVLVGVWMWSGFATVVLSAGLKSIPEEILEAARVDGATEFQIFRRVILPMLKPTVAVVATTLVIQALKIFDLIWVMTGGRNGTHVVATLFYQQTFVRRQFGLGAALAVVLFLAVLPIMAINVRQFEAGDGQT